MLPKLQLIEAFLAEELACREHSYLDDTGSAPADDETYIRSAREALDACREVVARSQDIAGKLEELQEFLRKQGQRLQPASTPTKP